MALNKYAAIRYRIIDQCIRSRSKPYPSKEDLRSACEEGLYGSSDGSHISMSTIDKDLWAMKNESAMGYAPIAFSRQENGYFYMDPDYSLNLPLTQEDIGMIRLAMKTLTHFRQSRLFQDLETAVNKIEGRILVAGHLAESGLDTRPMWTEYRGDTFITHIYLRSTKTFGIWSDWKKRAGLFVLWGSTGWRRFGSPVPGSQPIRASILCIFSDTALA